MTSPFPSRGLPSPVDSDQHLGLTSSPPKRVRVGGEFCSGASKRGRAWVLILLVGCIWVGSAAIGGMVAAHTARWGNGSDRDATEVKAALVFKFLRYVEWEESRFENPRSPLEVGVLGSGKIVDQLKQALKGEEYGKHPILFRRFATPDAVQDCHILFVTESAAGKKELKRALARLPREGVFVVGESKDFAIHGGVLNFYLEQRDGRAKVRFEVNTQEAKRRKVKISASLLKLARIVKDPKGRSESGRVSDSSTGQESGAGGARR